MEDDTKYQVQTTARTLEIIEALKQSDGAGVTELADQLDMGKSAVHNHLSTLEEYEYVKRSDGEYTLSLRFLEMGGYTRSQMDLFQVAKPEVDALAEETGELVNIAVEEHGQCVYLYRSRGSQAVNLGIHAGLRASLNTTALGKAILAHMDDERVEDIIGNSPLPSATPNTITDTEVLHEQFSQIREQGYAIDDEERLNGLRCVAAPVLQDGSVIGAVSVSAPTSRLEGSRLQESVPDQVVSTANVIKLNISYS